jgi:DNA-binding NarL/FixJ family response regulator
LESPSGEIRKLRALIVEDNDMFRETVKEILQTLFPSMAIEEATRGIEALQKVDMHHPELIFMDISLPEENGLQLTQKIKAGHPDAQIIVLTDYDILEYREAAIRCGASHFIPKSPLDWKEIGKTVRSLLPALEKP